MALVGRGAEDRSPEGATSGQVAPMCCQCAGGEATLLRPGRAAHAVTIKSRQHVRVSRDRQWQKFLRRINVKGILNCLEDAV